MLSAVVVAVMLAQSPTPTPPPPADGLLAGRVIDGVTGQPVPGVTVTLAVRPAPNAPPALSVSTPPPPRVLVDGAGRFVFSSLKPGTYDLVATKRGFVNGEFGKLRADGTRLPLALAPSERRVDVTLRVWKYASIAGTVLDEMNEPVVGVAVQALRREWVAGDMRLVRSSGENTDDRGRYRIGSLLPGDYVIGVPSTQSTRTVASLSEPGAQLGTLSTPSGLVAPPPPLGSRDNQRVGDLLLVGSATSIVQPGATADGPLVVYPTAYYPNTPDSPSGSLIALTAAEAKSIPPIHVRPVATVRVSGTLTGPVGPSSRTSLVLVPQVVDAFASESGFETARTVTDASGTFTFLGVTPGTYRVRAVTAIPPPAPPKPAGPEPPPPPPPTFWLTDTIIVGARDITVSLAMKPTFRVTGRLIFDGTRPQPRPEQMARDVVTFAAADGRQINRLGGRDLGSTDGNFAIQDVSGGRYVLTTWSVPGGWYLRSLTLNGQDVIDTPIDLAEDTSGMVVTFTDRPTSLKGTVRTVAGAADADALVIVFPINPQRWTSFSRSPLRFRGVRPDVAGAFSLTGLPPGEYFVAAVADASAANWQSAKYLDGLGRLAIRVTLDEGAPVQQDLKRVEVK